MGKYKINNEELNNKILTLGLDNYLTENKFLFSLLDIQIKFCKLQLNHLYGNRPFWFQRRKMKEYKIKVKELQDKIDYYYDCISIHFSYIDEVKNIKF